MRKAFCYVFFFLKLPRTGTVEVTYNLTLPSNSSKISLVTHLPLHIYIYVPGDIGKVSAFEE